MSVPIKIFHGLENAYPESMAGTDRWFYSQFTDCAEAYEVPEFNGNYPGTQLIFYDRCGNRYEPLAQEKNVFLSQPLYDPQADVMGFILYDFNEKVIQAYRYHPTEIKKPELLTEISMEEVGDVSGIRLILAPFRLVKDDTDPNIVDILWPEKHHYDLEEDEYLDFIDDAVIYTSRWVENPEYWEEVILRDAATGEVKERCPGYIRLMPDGTRWFMTI